MHNKSLKEIVLSGFFITLGLIFPIAFHGMGAGSTFLPMHIPVLIAGFVLRIPFAAAVGAATPILSSLLTGMPPTFPVLPFMMFELAVYGAMTSLLFRKFKLPIYVCLICSMIAGRIVSAVVVWILVAFFMAKLPHPMVFITGAVLQGIPGIVIQLIFIPAIITVLCKMNFIERKGIFI